MLHVLASTNFYGILNYVTGTWQYLEWDGTFVDSGKQLQKYKMLAARPLSPVIKTASKVSCE
jgi:hypothetical protein